jgi:beta-glucosidase
VALAATCFCHAADNFAPLDKPWMNKSLSPEERAKLLVQQMTLDEKISQIHMVDEREHPREVAGVPRLGIPVFKVTNGPLGAGPGDSRGAQPATALPEALALAASWDPAQAEAFGRITGQEVADRPEQLIEGPGVNITRVPQNGRNFEYFGEDPYLSGRMGVAEVKALQQQGIIAQVKHYAANSQETNRKTINEVIDERTLREIYLPAFEAVVKEADPGAVMAAYPSVNGQFCSENTHLLKDILRGEWGFKGFVQSDYTGTGNAAHAGRAGLDLAMKPNHYSGEMKAAITNGEITEAAVDTMVARRFTQMFRFGMFDSPLTPKQIPTAEDGAVARSIALQSAVLLKNNGNLLPLDAKAIRSIAVIGPYAGAAHTGGTGSSMVHPTYTIKPVEGIQQRAGAGIKVTYDPGTNITASAKLAKSADVVLLMVGNKDGEGKDRANLSLPGNQDGLISAVSTANPKTIVILKTGGPVLMPWLNHVPAVLEAWYPGQEDGNVVAELVFGDANPSGKLPMTFPKAENEVPAHTKQQYPGMNGTAVYSEKMEVGYRWYDAHQVAPLFPFGFGLSYTTFAVKNLSVAATGNGGTTVGVDVTNTGEREGAEVVQVYVASPASAGEPPKQLKGFSKVTLKPGETRHVNIPLEARAFSFWSTGDRRWELAPGQYQILAGTSSRDLPLKLGMTVAGR